jgi:hypothetical protein
VLLVLATLVANDIATNRIDSSAALLLVLPGVISTYLARPGEHYWVSRMLLGVRTLSVISAMSVYLAAAVVVTGIVPGAVREVWGTLAAVSLVPAVALGVALRRCRSATW